ncbi:MAG: hypothetical protein PHI47_06560, partial [Sulfuricurvum sp.]|uniref:hypothetical protein n=1 Tax=Sulfuricurvum sp. TaxID=2025608 RepID=UPI002607DBF9
APVAWNVTTGNTTIVGATFRTKFNDVYTSRQTLLNKIAATAKSIADSKVLPENVATAVNSNTTTINGGKITTDTAWIGGILQSSDFTTIGGAGFRLKTNAASTDADPDIYGAYIRGSNISGDNLVVDTAWIGGILQSSDFTTIGGAGFRLKTNAASTNADPDIYGAYIRGGTVDGVSVNAALLSASKFQVNGLTAFNSTYPANTAPMVIVGQTTRTSTGTMTLTFYGASYGTGHRADRFVNDPTLFVIDFFMSATVGTYDYVDCTISGTGVTTATARLTANNKAIQISTVGTLTQASSRSITLTMTVNGTVSSVNAIFRAVGYNIA